MKRRVSGQWEKAWLLAKSPEQVGVPEWERNLAGGQWPLAGGGHFFLSWRRRLETIGVWAREGISPHLFARLEKCLCGTSVTLLDTVRRVQGLGLGWQFTPHVWFGMYDSSLPTESKNFYAYLSWGCFFNWSWRVSGSLCLTNYVACNGIIRIINTTSYK